jgi:hypothetical protein
MSFQYYKFILFSFGITFFSSPYAHDIQNIDSQLEQLKLIINQIKESSQQNQAVSLGSDQVKKQTLIEQLNNQTNYLINTIQTIKSEATKSEKSLTNLYWLHNTDKKLTQEQLVNVGEAGSTINICRADFLGAYPQTQGQYPGQLTKEGCRISYGGYAFIVTQYYVLTGNGKNLEWVSIDDIIKQIQTKNTHGNQGGNVIKPLKILHSTGVYYNSLGDSSLQNSINNIEIKNARPISGGYEGGNPVLICLAKHNNVQTIGKLVFFDTGYACDIGVNDKEVVISNDYKLLFWKKTQ